LSALLPSTELSGTRDNTPVPHKSSPSDAIGCTYVPGRYVAVESPAGGSATRNTPAAEPISSNTFVASSRQVKTCPATKHSVSDGPRPKVGIGSGRHKANREL